MLICEQRMHALVKLGPKTQFQKAHNTADLWKVILFFLNCNYNSPYIKKTLKPTDF